MSAETSLRFPVEVDRGLGRLAQETDHGRHVEQLMRQVLLTNPGERVNRPDLGCGLRAMVFSPNSEVTAGLAQVAIFQALTEWLGDLIEVDRVEARALGEVLELRIAYLLRSRGERRFLNIEVTL
jgi:phage baseplate assembly protein W